jgi:5S rRNA maturation endonuclease (ribonuclease M5)
MNLFELFNNPKQQLVEGGNLAIGQDQADQINLQVTNRSYIVPILNSLLGAINNAFSKQYKTPLWSPALLQKQTFLSGSSLHFFNVSGISDEQFIAKKPKVGDIDTMVSKEAEPNLEAFLTANSGKQIGPAKLIGFQRGNEQFSSLWALQDPPIKVQIDLEFVAQQNDEPTDWARFSHSSSWEDLQAGVKGVFHKFLIGSLGTLSQKEFLLRKAVGRGKARAEQNVPTTDNMVSFAVSSKEGGGLRAKYEPVLDDQGLPLVVDGLQVMRALPPENYEQEIDKIFLTMFGDRLGPKQAKQLSDKFWSFTGLLDVMNTLLSPEEKQNVVGAFIEKTFGKGAQGLYRGDPTRDAAEKTAALDLLFNKLQIQKPGDLEQMKKDYTSSYKVTSESINEAEVKAQLRKGMPHLRDLSPADFLDLLDEIHDGNGNFKLQNIPLNVKVDGFGGRFGKNADGQPFMATSRTEPRYKAGFLDYHKQKGTTDPEILNRAGLFDELFNKMMDAVKVVDGKLGPDFLVNKQVTCEVLFAPFATETPEGKLKFVGIEYDKLPQGVELVLVPYRIVDATTGEDDPDTEGALKAMTGIGNVGEVMFLSNRLVQKEGLDVTQIINPLDNLEELKQIVSDVAGKRDRASQELKRQVIEKLKPVQIALEKAVDEDPNIVGKDMLGQDYEGIVINSRLGPIKVTSQRQKDLMTAKNAARAAARQEQPRTSGNKTAVVAVGSFVGHVGHEQLWDYTIKKAKEVGGDPYLFIGNAQGKDDPIPPSVKVQTWHKMYPEYAKNISTVTQQGGTLMQKIKHEIINPLPGKPPRYDNVIIMVGEDQAGMNIAQALMKAVNKFQGYEHVKVSLEATPRGTGMSFTKLRNILKDPNATEQQQLAVWSQGFDVNKLGADWIKHLMDITREGMGIKKIQQPAPQPAPVAERLFNALMRPAVDEAARMSAAVKLQRAFQRQQEKSTASRKRGEEVMAQARADAEKKSKEQGVAEGLVKDIKRLATGKDVKSRAGQEIAKSQDASMKGDTKTSKKHFDRYDKLDKLANKTPNKKSSRWNHNDISDVIGDMFDEGKGMAEGAPIVVMPRADRLKKAEPTKVRYQGDIVPPTKPPSTEKRGVKGRPGQRPMPKYDETMLPTSAFAGTKKNKLGSAAHLKGGMNRPAKAGDFVGGEGIEEEKQKGVDGKACWKGYKRMGTKKKGGKTVDNCVPIGEHWEQKIASAIKLLESK